MWRWLAILSLAAALPAVAERHADLHFQRIGPERGFQAGRVTVIQQDRTGFLWVGTGEGLLQYDGYSVTAFEHDAEQPGSLAGNDVRAILEDRQGLLWVGMRDGGLDVLDRATGLFSHHRTDPADAASLPNNSVFALLEDRQGRLWVGTQEGLVRFQPSTGGFEAAGVAGWVVDLFEDREGRLWVATFGGGVLRRDPGAGFRAVDVVGAPAEFRPGRARCLAQDADGTIWVGIAGGLLRFDESAGVLRAVEIPIGPDGPAGLPTASDLAAAADGTLWVATPGGGLVAMDPRTGDGTRYSNRVGVGNSLSSDNVQCLHLGGDGTLWIGTGEGTLDQLRPDADLFSIVRGRDLGSDFGYGRDVIEDEAGRLWVASFGNGVQIFDRSGRGVASWPARPVLDSGERTIVTLAPAAGGGAWLGTPIGLARASADGRPERWWRPDPATPDTLGQGYVQAILERSDGSVWIGTGGAGLYRMRADRSGFEAFRHDPGDDGGLADDFVTALVEGGDGRLWIGTASGGVHAFDDAAGRPRPIRADSAAGRILSRQSVSSLAADRAGRVWVGTAAGGLFAVDRENDAVQVTRFGEADGLVNDNVESVLEDDDGTLWIATRRGLARFDPARGMFATFGIEDGLPSPTFQTGSAARGGTALYFGTRRGVVAVPRGTPFPARVPSPTSLTSLRTLAGPVAADRPVPDLERIAIPYGGALFVDYAVLDYRAPDRHRFAYRFGGPEADWIDVGNRRALTFTDLDPGHHVLNVRGRNAQGVWAELPRPLIIDVVPPFWMTTWFRALTLLAVAALGWAWIRLRFRALERRNRQLEALHRDREAALAQARESEQALQGAYGRLRRLTRRLEDAKEEERRRIARELHDEMGQALSAVKINLKVLGRSTAAGAATERVEDALELVDGIIHHVRALSLDLRPPLLDELGLVPALRGYVEGQSARSGTAMVVEANAEAGDIPPEIAIAAFRIVQESIHNVMRHAPGAGQVTVSVRRDPQHLTLIVSDDGPGFDLAPTLERAATGRHLGLLGMRERIEALGGRFEVETAPGRGTTVHARIPLVAAEVPA